MHRLERLFESTLAASRWLLAPVYLGLVVVLALIVGKFGVELWHAITHFNELTEAKLVIIALALVDITLLAGLVLMVILSGYRNLVSEFRTQDMESLPAWVRELDPSGLKLKLFGSIVAISGIQVLRAFMDLSTGEGKGTDEARVTLAWLAAGHFVLVVSALLLALTERIAAGRKVG